MKLRKYLCLLLCALMCAATLCSCGRITLHEGQGVENGCVNKKDGTVYLHASPVYEAVALCDERGKLKVTDSESYKLYTIPDMDEIRWLATEEKYILYTEDTDTGVMLQNDAGFMHYDYNQTQTVYNETKLQDGEKYMAVMVPVAKWFDGTNADGVFMRFTESWRSVKTDGWAISVKGVEGNQDKLYAALKLIDYAYSEEGQILMSYGPDAFIKKNDDGSYVTFNFNGKEMPVIADATFAELWEKASGNYTNYARQFLGSTLSFLKSQAFEVQCTAEAGREVEIVIPEI